MVYVEFKIIDIIRFIDIRWKKYKEKKIEKKICNGIMVLWIICYYINK